MLEQTATADVNQYRCANFTHCAQLSQVRRRHSLYNSAYNVDIVQWYKLVSRS